MFACGEFVDLFVHRCYKFNYIYTTFYIFGLYSFSNTAAGIP